MFPLARPATGEGGQIRPSVMAPEPPAGSQVAATMHGVPKVDTSLAVTTSLHGDVEPNVFGVPYQPPPVVIPPDRAKKCRGKDDTCNGWRINDSEFCAYHAGKLRQGAP